MSSDVGGAHLVLASDPLAVRDALRALIAAQPLRDLSPSGRGTAELALAEALNNIVEHAYAATPGLIEVTLAPCPTGIACRIEDAGSAMPGGHLPAGRLPDCIGVPTDDLPEGGFGWSLIRSLTVDLRYERAGGRNRLTFTLPPEGP